MSGAVQTSMFSGKLTIGPGYAHRALGFDLSTNLGWAFAEISPKGEVVRGDTGCLELPKAHGARYVRTKALYEQLIRLYEPTVIGVETVSFAQNEAWRRLYYGQLAMLDYVGATSGVRIVGVPTSSVKVFAGAGNASKADVMEAAAGWLRRPLATSHEADALMVSIVAASQGRVRGE